MTKILKEFCAGAVSGACAKTIVAPLELVKIRYQVSTTKFSWKNAYNQLRYIYNCEGIFGLWRGHSANLYRVVPYSAIQFSTFDVAKSRLKHPVKYYELFGAGAFAGIVSTIVVYPLDLIRARFAVNRPVISGVFQNLKRDIGENGIKSIYRGLIPTLLGLFRIQV